MRSERNHYKLGNYNELIRKFEKIRSYMRAFYIYGFQKRSDFNHKSSRTYDNEKRRIESYMGDYMKWSYTRSGKKSFISMNCATLSTNPLYTAWKSKAFTDNDIILHFYILSALEQHGPLPIETLTDEISYISGKAIDSQTLRNKCKEYIKEGLVIAEKKGKTLFYQLSPLTLDKVIKKVPDLIEGIKFFQGDTWLGEIGSFILTQSNDVNDQFLFKHYYISHTLEDGILIDILHALKHNKGISFINHNEKKSWVSEIEGIPLKIFVSATTGRRYVCIYKPKSGRFFNYRLDHIESVRLLEVCEEAISLKTKLENHLPKLWGVSFGGHIRSEYITLTLRIDEKREGYILERIRREGHGGTLIQLEETVFQYHIELFDSNDVAPWIKTFMGRILKVEGNNKAVIKRFYEDIKRMKEMYEESV